MNNRTIKLKICGMREPENMREIATLNPDFLGLIFYPKSPRYVSPEKAKELPLFDGIERIGVFVNENLENIRIIAEETGLSFVQLHGSESPEFCAMLKTQDLKVIKAFAVDESFDSAVLQRYEDVCDFFLFDTKTNAHGGSGKSFNWRILQSLSVNKPFFLGGGIGAENTAEAISACCGLPLYALDVNSRAEIAPGVKSPAIVREIINQKYKGTEKVNHI